MVGLKPRRLSDPLTEEDRAAWFDWQVNRRRNWALWGSLEAYSFNADRRDADLMFGWEDAKARYIADAGVFAYWRARALGVDLARRAIR
jgi:hypothetical protein